MRPVPTARELERLRRIGLLVILLLGLLLHVVIFVVERNDGMMTLLLSVMGIVLGVLVVVLYGLKRISTELVSRLLLWFAVAWNALSMLTGLLDSQRLQPTIYLSHPALVVMVFTLLPLRRAAAMSMISLVLLVMLAVTRSSVDWVLLTATGFIGFLISYMMFFGQSSLTASEWAGPAMTPALDAATGLLTRQAALERLRAMRRMGTTQVSSGAVMLLEARGLNEQFYGPAARAEVLRGLSHLLRQRLQEQDFACRWADHTLLVVWHDADRKPFPDRTAELPFRDGRLPISIDSGTAYFDESPDVQGVIALAEVRLEQNRQALQAAPQFRQRSQPDAPHKGRD